MPNYGRLGFFPLVIITNMKCKSSPVHGGTNALEKSGCGEIGRRTRLRIWRRKACRFDPYHPHNLSQTPLRKERDFLNLNSKITWQQ